MFENVLIPLISLLCTILIHRASLSRSESSRTLRIITAWASWKRPSTGCWPWAHRSARPHTNSPPPSYVCWLTRFRDRVRWSCIKRYGLETHRHCRGWELKGGLKGLKYFLWSSFIMIFFSCMLLEQFIVNILISCMKAQWWQKISSAFCLNVCQ